MTFPGCISSDSHIYEPPDLWTSRIVRKFRDRAPIIIRSDGRDAWFCEGYTIASPALGAAVGLRFGSFERSLRLEERMGDFEETFDAVRQGGYLAEPRIQDMDLDGIDIDILYPSAGFRAVVLVRDNELLKAICTSYNDWLADYCREFPSRLKGIALLTLDDIDWGVQELYRCRKLGLIGAMIPTGPPEGMPYSEKAYDPFWAAAQDLDIPLSFHVGVRRPQANEQLPNPWDQMPSSRSTKDYWVRVALCHMIFGQVFVRYPRLIVGSIEYENGWVPYFLSQIDYTYTQRSANIGWDKFDDPHMIPSDFYKRNCFVSFQEDIIGIKLRDMIGAHTLTWGSDYPHIESTFPRSREILQDILSDCNPLEKHLIVAGNAARIYGLQTPSEDKS
ncbi:amidohydrolase [Dehalococcoidia bacterium]|nr:amidohydrolase [Dehalococcoidia bacterium]